MCGWASVLTVVPSVLLLLGTAPRLFRLLQKGPLEGVKLGFWFFVKTAFAIIALALQIALLAVLVKRDYPLSAILSSVLYGVSIVSYATLLLFMSLYGGET